MSRPFQPSEVRGFSKYTRMTMCRRSARSAGCAGEAGRVVAGGVGIVHRAGTDDDHEAVVDAVEDVDGGLTAGADRGDCGVVRAVLGAKLCG